jgi:tRNA nucleotidyltransferase (CCA-adding enzyme)
MKNKINFEYPNILNNMFDKLDKNNIKPIIVGGYVRDYFLNIYSNDIDIELYNLDSYKNLEKILSEFGELNSVGKSFGVCKLSINNLDIDFTLPRKDNKISSGHKGFEIKIDTNLDFKTASSRRDFTINSIGYDIKNKIILDPYSGIDDIKNKIIRAVDIDKFSQDPLRVLRAVVFASRFDFKIEKNLFLKSKTLSKNKKLYELPKERIFTEIKKILLKSKKPSIAFNLLYKLDALKYLSPLDKLSRLEFKDTLDSLDKLTVIKTNNNKTDISLMLAVICYKLNENQTIKFIANLTNEKELIKDILKFKQNSLKTNYSNYELYILATKVNIEYFLLYSLVTNKDIKKDYIEKLKNRVIKLKILNTKLKPLLKGRDILACGIEPSKKYKDILLKAYDAQMRLEIKTHSEAINWLKNYLKVNYPQEL